MTNFFDIAVTPKVLEIQEQKGSLGMYTSEVGAGPGEAHTLDPSEVLFLTSRDNFYMATVSESGWPYVQHRGGDPGFVKILGDHTIGWVERSGNRQYIGTGNVAANGKVSLIFVDYPNRTRLKIFGRATYHPVASPQLLHALGAEGIRSDGAITVELLSAAWNCPKYITPRYTEPQIAGALERLQDRIDELERELESTRAREAR